MVNSLLSNSNLISCGVGWLPKHNPFQNAHPPKKSRHRVAKLQWRDLCRLAFKSETVDKNHLVSFPNKIPIIVVTSIRKKIETGSTTEMGKMSTNSSMAMSDYPATTFLRPLSLFQIKMRSHKRNILTGRHGTVFHDRSPSQARVQIVDQLLPNSIKSAAISKAPKIRQDICVNFQRTLQNVREYGTKLGLTIE